MDIVGKANKASEVQTTISTRKKRKLKNHDTITEKSTLSQSAKDLKNVESNETIEETTKTIRNKKSKTKKRSEDAKLTANKKIKFDGDESKQAQKKTNNPKEKNHFNDEDEEVKDEDIDKFCEEIDEEDNKQYEDWVKLFEANFRSKKKKT